MANKKLILTSGVISFFRKIDRMNENHIKWIQEVFYIQPEEFWEYVNVLHKNEIVDLYEDEVVKISDQVLSTYLFYHCVFEKKYVSFSHLVKNFFPDFKQTIIDALNPVIDAFDHRQIIDDIRKDIKEIYSETKDTNSTLQLLDCFWFAIPTETLCYVKNIISELNEENINWEDKDFEASKDRAPKGSLIHILSKFRYYCEAELSISFELNSNTQGGSFRWIITARRSFIPPTAGLEKMW